MNNENDILLDRIANHLILHSWGLNDISLFYGKMGIVLFFAHYARYTGKTIYEDFASELLEDISENILDTLPIDLGRGLCGIGWGIEYLVQNKFMDAESDDILVEIDQKVMERDLRRISDLSVETGLRGISYYIQSRIDSGHTPKFDNSYLSEWRKKSSLFPVLNNKNLLLDIIDKNEFCLNFLLKELGLVNGVSGIGLKVMLL